MSDIDVYPGLYAGSCTQRAAILEIVLVGFLWSIFLSLCLLRYAVFLCYWKGSVSRGC